MLTNTDRTAAVACPLKTFWKRLARVGPGSTCNGSVIGLLRVQHALAVAELVEVTHAAGRKLGWTGFRSLYVDSNTELNGPRGTTWLRGAATARTILADSDRLRRLLQWLLMPLAARLPEALQPGAVGDQPPPLALDWIDTLSRLEAELRRELSLKSFGADRPGLANVVIKARRAVRIRRCAAVAALLAAGCSLAFAARLVPWQIVGSLVSTRDTSNTFDEARQSSADNFERTVAAAPSNLGRDKPWQREQSTPPSNWPPLPSVAKSAGVEALRGRPLVFKQGTPATNNSVPVPTNRTPDSTPRLSQPIGTADARKNLTPQTSLPSVKQAAATNHPRVDPDPTPRERPESARDASGSTVPLTAEWHPLQDGIAELVLHRGERQVALTFVLIRGGTFTMGNDSVSGSRDEAPTRQINVNDFFLATHELTRAATACVLGLTWPEPHEEQLPASSLNWTEASDLCRVLQHSLRDAVSEVRLPWESEWEYAAKTGMPAGFSPVAHAWFDANSAAQTHVVGEKVASQHGIHDLFGNVGEWVRDAYSPLSYVRAEPLLDGADGVVRGGSFASPSVDLRASRRWKISRSSRLTNVGVRLVVIGK